MTEQFAQKCIIPYDADDHDMIYLKNIKGGISWRATVKKFNGCEKIMYE